MASSTPARYVLIKSIVDIMLKDEPFLRAWFQIYQALHLPKDELETIQYKKNCGNLPNRELWTKILDLWITNSKSERNVGELYHLLYDEGFRNVAGKLEQFGLQSAILARAPESEGEHLHSSTADHNDPTTCLGDQGQNINASRHSSHSQTETDSSNNIRAPDARRSEVNSGFTVTQDHWVISLVRNSRAVHNRQHVFLILESLPDANTVRTVFMDFATSKAQDVTRLGLESGNIRKDAKQGPLKACLLYSSVIALMKIEKPPAELYCSKSWSISRQQGELLEKNVTDQMERSTQPKFHIAGRDSFAADVVAFLSGSEPGYNCYTWASYQIKSLNDSGILLPDHASWVKKLFSLPSMYLVDDDYWDRFRRKMFLGKVSSSCFILIVAVIIYYLRQYFW